MASSSSTSYAAARIYICKREERKSYFRLAQLCRPFKKKKKKSVLRDAAAASVKSNHLEIAMTREEEKRGENILLFLVYNQEVEEAAETFWTTIDLCVLCVNKGASGRENCLFG